jgi:hypothetical protein
LFTLLVACAAALAVPAADAQTPPGRTYRPGNFDAIDITGSAVVRFVQGSADQVFVEGDDDTQQAVGFEVHDGRLQIHPRGAWKFWNDRRLEIEVTARDLTRVGIYGAADFRASGPVKVDRLTVDIAGAGLARFDRLNADNLSFQVSGAGNGDISGIAKNLNVRISGRSSFRGENLKSENAKVAVSGIGDVKIWATQDLGISVAGVGTIDYWGSPAVTRSVSGKATINDRGAK